MAKTYTIQRGDTLSDIAERNNTTVEALAKANNIQDPSMVYPGTTLNIPEQRIGPGTGLATLPNVEKTGEREKADLTPKRVGPGTGLETLPNVEKTGEKEKPDMSSDQTTAEDVRENTEQNQNAFNQKPYQTAPEGAETTTPSGVWEDRETGARYSGKRKNPDDILIEPSDKWKNRGEEESDTRNQYIPEGPVAQKREVNVTKRTSDYEKKEKINQDSGTEDKEGSETPEGGKDKDFASWWSDMEESKYYKALDEDMKDLVKFYGETLYSQNEEKARSFDQALKLAKKQAGPYWSEKISIVEDNLERSLEATEADLVSREEQLSRRKERLKEDLKYKKDELSTEEAAELSKRERRYEKELDNIRKKMANRGLSFSSIRNEAEEYQEEEYDDIVESTKRQYDRELRQARKEKERGITDIESDLEDVRRKARETKTTAVRKAEEKLGTEELSDIEGAQDYTMGDLSGTFEERKASDLLTRTQGLMLGNYGG